MALSDGGVAVTIAKKDLRQRLRDRTAFLIGVLLPFALASILSLTLGDVAEGDLDLRIGLVDLDGGVAANGFEEALRSADIGAVHELRDRSTAERRAEEGDLDAVFVLPQGLSSSATTGRGGSIEMIGSPDSDLGPLVATSFARSYAARLDGIAVAVGTTATDPGTAPELAGEAARMQPAAVLNRSVTQEEGVNPSTFTAIGMAVFFLFFTVEFGVRSVIEEREGGTLARLMAAPIRPSTVLIGKGLASFSVGALSTGLLVVATTLLLDADWGPAIGVVVLVVVGVATAVAVTSFVATFAKTSAQAGSFASVVAVVGGLLGGTFFPISQAPELLASARFLSPQGWLMEGFGELATGGGLAGAAPALAGTLAIGFVFGTLAWFRARRLLVP
jgi:ABC-2 type transport system permease protein